MEGEGAMKSSEYRDIVRKIVVNRLTKDAPGLKKKIP